jgi:hypothetical protein
MQRSLFHRQKNSAKADFVARCEEGSGAAAGGDDPITDCVSLRSAWKVMEDS